MRMIGGTALAAGAVAFLAACSDTPMQPSAPALKAAAPAPSFVLLAQPTNNEQGPNTITVCSANAAATFSVSFATSNLAWEQVPPLVDVDANPGGPYTLDVPAGACRTIWSKPGQPPSVDPVTTATIFQTGQADGFAFQMVEVGGNLTNVADNGTQTATLQANAFHGATATFTQRVVEPPPEACDFSTFGGFVLLPNNISYGGNAGFASSGFAYGSLNFKNHTTGDHIHVWNVTEYGHPETGPLSQFKDSRLAFGMGSINGGPVNVPVEFRFLDSGEPAKKLGDKVYLKVGNDILIPEQNVNGGNIQLHAKCKKAPKAEKH
jgi:hypothetical protein